MQVIVVRDLTTAEIIKAILADNISERTLEQALRGLLTQIDTDRYCVGVMETEAATQYADWSLPSVKRVPLEIMQLKNGLYQGLSGLLSRQST